MLKKISVLLLGILITSSSFAGNPDRVGQSGAQQLVANPWARSSGWNGANIAGISGVEAMQYNVAGLGNINSTEFVAARTNWLGNSSVGININAFGISQVVGKDKTDAIGLSIVSWDFGDIPITTENGGGDLQQGSYKISMVNIGLGYSHKFSNAISTGFVLRYITEGIPTVSANGLAIDAGIQYVAGKKDRAKFGVSIRNVGPTMTYGGGGLATRGAIDGTEYSMALQSRSNEFELPSMLNIGASYDIFMDSAVSQKITVAGGFTSNAFDKDQYSLGLQYGFRKYLMLRAGYTYEQDMFNTDARTKVYSGPCVGATVDIPFGKEGKQRFGVDYSYRSSIFTGTHCFGVRLTL